MQRLTITVDRDLVAKARSAIDAGGADSMSEWVNTALRETVTRDRKRRELGGGDRRVRRDHRRGINAVRRADGVDAVVVGGDT